MAKRPSVKEILEAARRGESPRPEPDAEPTPTPPPPAAEAAPSKPDAPSNPPGRPLTLQEKLAAARGQAPAPAEAPATSTEAPAPTVQPTDRPLTLQEKLAAARGQAPAPAESEAEAAALAETATATMTAEAPDRPLTLQEKLAAARGQAAATAAPAAKPAAAKTTDAAPKVAKARVLPPVDQISDPRDLAEALRRAGSRRKQEAVARASAPPRKPAAKSAAKKPSTILPAPDRDQIVGRKPRKGAEIKRRWFMALLSPIAIAWSSFAGAIGLFTAMMGRYMFPNVLAEPPSSVKVGLPSSYDPDEVSERFKAEWGFWIVRSSEYDGQDAIFALKAVCTHLGCPPNWMPSDAKFKCPCHGSGFDICGVNFEGPAPRPLERYRVALADDGQILVDKTQWYQQELGQWSDPDSFIPV